MAVTRTSMPKILLQLYAIIASGIVQVKEISASTARFAKVWHVC